MADVAVSEITLPTNAADELIHWLCCSCDNDNLVSRCGAELTQSIEATDPAEVNCLICIEFDQTGYCPYRECPIT